MAAVRGAAVIGPLRPDWHRATDRLLITWTGAFDPKAASTGPIWLPRSSRWGRATVQMCWRRLRVGPGGRTDTAVRQKLSAELKDVFAIVGRSHSQGGSPSGARRRYPGDSTRSATPGPTGISQGQIRRSNRPGAPNAPVLSTQSTRLAAGRHPSTPGGAILPASTVAISPPLLASCANRGYDEHQIGRG